MTVFISNTLSYFSNQTNNFILHILPVLIYFCSIHILFNENYMNCLSRSDSNKAIFDQPIYARKKHKRTNYFNLIPIENDVLICGKWNYSISSICHFQTEPKTIHVQHPCQLSNKDVIEIHPTFSFNPDLCFDYSFWKNPNRCSNHAMENNTHAISCNRIKANCDSFRGEYCPKSSTSRKCSKVTHFYCESSETCIPKGTPHFIFIFG